jgi:hypothetical protein
MAWSPFTGTAFKSGLIVAISLSKMGSERTAVDPDFHELGMD